MRRADSTPYPYAAGTNQMLHMGTAENQFQQATYPPIEENVELSPKFSSHDGEDTHSLELG